MSFTLEELKASTVFKDSDEDERDKLITSFITQRVDQGEMSRMAGFINSTLDQLIRRHAN